MLSFGEVAGRGGKIEWGRVWVCAALTGWPCCASTVVKVEALFRRRYV